MPRGDGPTSDHYYICSCPYHVVGGANAFPYQVTSLNQEKEPKKKDCISEISLTVCA